MELDFVTSSLRLPLLLKMTLWEGSWESAAAAADDAKGVRL
jgi:hypothetical protein